MSSNRSNRLLLALLLSLVALVGTGLCTSPELTKARAPTVLDVSSSDTLESVAVRRDIQRQVIHLLSQDDLSHAERLLVDTLTLSADETLRLRAWLTEYQEFRAGRDTRRREGAAEYIAKAQENIQQEKLQEALANAYLAILVSSEPEEIRSQEWLKDLVQLCAAEGEEFSEQGEYGKAALILREIALIFNEDKSWKRRLEQTGLRAGILGAYGKDSKWHKRLRDVRNDDFKKAVAIIDKHYVKRVDYRKMFLAAMEGFQTFLTTQGMENAFPSLADKRLAVVALVDFLEQKVDWANKERNISGGDLLKAYYQTILKNRQELGLPDAVLVDLFSGQALQALDDYTEMIWPDQQRWLSRTTTGSFSGIGVQIRLNQAKQLEVVTPLSGTPAFGAGLQASDLIVAVDGKSTEGIAINEAVRRITGEKGTSVTLTIRRPGRPEEFDVAIVRDVIKIKSVLGYNRLEDNTWDYMVDESERIAYIRISNFMRNTPQELDDSIKACRERDVRAIIIDLRFNPGGTLRAAEEVSDRFLDVDQKIVSTRGYWATPYVAKARSPDLCRGLPIVVLTSDKSASSAEIVSGALQDNDRASIVGERTYGKGLVQRPFRLSGWGEDEVAVKVTTAYWYLPKGRNVQRSDESDSWGVEPNFEVDMTPKEFTSLRKRWLNAEIIRVKEESGNGHFPPATSEPSSKQPQEDPVASPETTNDIEEMLETEEPASEEHVLLPDPQLETALLVARLELLFNQR